MSETPLQTAFQSNQVVSVYRRDWELGRWDQLAKIDYTACESDADAASLALIAATGNQVLGNLERVRACIEFAMDHGCPRYAAIQVLTSGLHNVLGRARIAAGQDEAAISQFRSAVEIGARQGRESLTAAARQEEERDQLGLRQSEPGPAGQTANTAADGARREPCTRTPAILTYRQAPRKLVESESAPFILLDSKSLPRSGLHYMRKQFAEALGNRFSFCEWYQEPGCCRQRPCALTSFLERRCSRHESTLRLIKSHDFDLDDPVDEPSYCLRRLILIRDPIYVLTSWFALDQIEEHKEELAAFSLDTRKLYYSHEPEVVGAIYEVLEERFRPPSEQVFSTWLNKRTEFIRRFIEKWIPSEFSSSNPYVYVVNYTEIDSFVNSMLSEIQEHPKEKKRIRSSCEMSERVRSDFSPRTDPFQHACSPLDLFLRTHADAFRLAVKTLPTVR